MAWEKTSQARQLHSKTAISLSLGKLVPWDSQGVSQAYALQPHLSLGNRGTKVPVFPRLPVKEPSPSGAWPRFTQRPPGHVPFPTGSVFLGEGAVEKVDTRSNREHLVH